MKVPEKCQKCNHTIIRFEQVHKGNCKYQYEHVVRCDCHPAEYIVGCISAKQYCKNKNPE